MLTERQESALLPVYAQFPVRPVRGEGSWIIDVDGHRWLDAYGGHAVASTGHCHPHVVRAIAEQASQLIFYSTVLPHPNREQLAARIAALMPAGLDRSFFCNSGAEANENALALARKRTGREVVASVTGGWHGRTVATLAVTDGAKYEAGARRAGMPLSQKIPFDDVDALERAIDDSVAALIVEPVQGMSGARDSSHAFLRAAREVCTRHGVALIFDEIQCGVGRLGAFTAAEFYGVTPDAITLAKGLASGFPIACVTVGDFLAEGIGIGDLGSTFGGGPLACAAGLATLDVIERDDLAGNAARVGLQLREGALALGIPSVQGHGLLLGLRLGRPAQPVQRALFERRILTGTSGDPEVLRLLPPLSFSKGRSGPSAGRARRGAVVIEVRGSAGPLAVDDGGTGEPVCLLVHSLGGRLAFWASTLEALRTNHRAVALDLRGHGASAPAAFAQSGLDNFVDDVLQVADSLSLSQFVLVGHSFGATVALATAVRAPRRVLALALVDPAGAFDQVPVSTLEAFIDTVLQDEDGAFVRAAYEANLERATPEARAAVLASLAATGRDTLGAAYTAMFATDARQLMLRYPGPVRLIVDAANDSPMSLHAQVPDLDILRIEGASHWLMLDQPEQFALALKEFVDAQSVPQ